MGDVVAAHIKNLLFGDTPAALVKVAHVARAVCVTIARRADTGDAAEPAGAIGGDLTPSRERGHIFVDEFDFFVDGFGALVERRGRLGDAGGEKEQNQDGSEGISRRHREDGSQVPRPIRPRHTLQGGRRGLPPLPNDVEFRIFRMPRRPTVSHSRQFRGLYMAFPSDSDILHLKIEAQARDIERLTTAQALVENALDGITLVSMENRLVYANTSFKAMCGYGHDAVGRSLADFYSPEELDRLTREVVPELLGKGTWSGTLEVRRPDGSTWMGQTSAFVVRDAAGAPTGMAAFFRDVTAQLEAEQARERLQEELIQAQQRALRALGTPLLPIADRVLAMPLIGDIDAERAQQIMETLLDGITRHQAATVILDITGVKVMDTAAADALVGAARGARLLGAEVVMTGTSPKVARTLVDLGADLRGIVTRGALQSGIAWALARNHG
ncbi:PAS domain S-box protein [Polyangium spumosum]|uniref:PAS domain S-box protein n=2 Tax=Polyangium spumosum TaxID=889282 RepID=A0A6N7Q272_9BACT|nr:PAS domain S-box protein [Polyangium spumosum]